MKSNCPELLVNTVTSTGLPRSSVPVNRIDTDAIPSSPNCRLPSLFRSAKTSPDTLAGTNSPNRFPLPTVVTPSRQSEVDLVVR